MATARQQRRQQRREDRRQRRATRKSDRQSRSDLSGKERRTTRRAQLEARGETRREQRVSRQLAYKPERAADICSPSGAAQRETFNKVVGSPAWTAAAQSLNTGANLLWAAPDPTLLSKLAAGVTDAVGYAMKGASVAGPSVNAIRENLACAMVNELEKTGGLQASEVEPLQVRASALVVSRGEVIPFSGEPSAFNPELAKTNQALSWLPYVGAAFLTFYLFRR